MKESQFLICNGILHPSQQLLISPDNRSFKYSDGFFETMKMINSNIILQDLHFERLFSSLQTMQFEKRDNFTKEHLLQQIQELAVKNNHTSLSRIRINIFRGDGGLYDVENNQPNYIIQNWSLPQFPTYNEQGLSIDIYKNARKTSDAFSHLKSNNYLPYAMAALWCKKNNFNDALIINCYDRIAEATTSNVFIVKDGKLKTPALSEGCIAGVTRRYLLTCFQKENISCEEGKITLNDVMNADEILFTNTGWFIQWVKQCGNKTYTNQTSKVLYKKFITPLLKSR